MTLTPEQIEALQDMVAHEGEVRWRDGYGYAWRYAQGHYWQQQPDRTWSQGNPRYCTFTRIQPQRSKGNDYAEDEERRGCRSASRKRAGGEAVKSIEERARAYAEA